VSDKETRLLQKSAAKWKGKWALVTGASAGIGKSLVEELAESGANVVLTARRGDRLQALAQTLSATHKIRAEFCVADLADPAGPEKILAFTHDKNIQIDLLINNAGFGNHGEFAASDRSRQVEMVQVNCAAVVNLTHLFLPPMIQRKSGDILIVASTAAFQAVPYISTYAATKAFDLSFAEGLAEEVKPYGIQVCALCPGSTESEFHQIASRLHSASSHRRRESSEKVARTGLNALAAGKSFVISGAGNYLGAQVQRLVPRRLVTSIAARLFRPAPNPSR
jgi:short-subunit dehydrogenase